jgi:hypothetical protein
MMADTASSTRPRRNAGDRRHVQWLLTVALLALMATSLPYLYGYLSRPEGSRFWAVPPYNEQDANQYLAFPRLVAAHGPLVGDPFTAEPHAARLFLPEAVLQAALSHTLGWTDLAVFQLVRVLFGAALLLAAWWLGSLLIRQRPLQRLYMAFVCFSAGGGWIVDILRPGTVHGDAYQPEGNTFFLLGNLPHLILAAALLTALFAARVAMGRGQLRRPAHLPIVITAICSFLLSWTHPWDFLSLGLGCTAYACWLLIEERRIPWASVVHLAVTGLAALPAAVYLVWITRADPVYARLANDVMVVQRWPFYLIAHGLLAAPALLVVANSRLRSRFALPLCWVICVFLFMFTPVRMGGKQSRLPGGVHVPLAMLAAVGVHRVARRSAALVASRSSGRSTLSPVSRDAVAGAICWGCLGVTAIGAGAMLYRHWAAYHPPTPAYFHTRDTQHAFDRLEKLGDDSQVTLGGPYTAGWAPTLADTRTYYGHWHMTLQEPQKRAARDWFFTANATPEQRADWLNEQAITWVIWAPWEWPLPAADLRHVPGLEPVFAGGDIVLYRFRRDGR